MANHGLSTEFSTTTVAGATQSRRTEALRRMATETFDLAIIGGGINGAGVARDAASRGMKVALVEAQDFASGTSSRSSKLIHGGIRYLENLEFGLVFEALSERARLFDLAPHLVHPLRFLIPMYKTGRVPTWKMALGMIAYDVLSLFEAPDLHEFLDAAEVADQFPMLQKAELDGGFLYSDAYMDDDRLVLETMRSAERLGAVVANYARAVEFSSGGLNALACVDVESGLPFTIKARHFVGCVGPWTDRLGQGLFQKEWRTKLRPSKGVHLTFRKDRFQLSHAVVMGAESRIVFAIPRHEMVIVGTTDTDFRADPSQVRTEIEDVRYILDVIADYFPGAKITADDIVGCYAGVRPLIDDGAQSESKTSREHVIWTERERVTFVAGGKYTTYRLMAEQTVAEALRHFPLSDQVRFNRSQTLSPLNELVTASALERAERECDQWSSLRPTLAKLLAERHGMEGLDILRRAETFAPTLAEKIGSLDFSGEQWMWCAEALHAVENTMCLHLSDFYLRRTPLVLARLDHGLGFARAVAETMSLALGWSREKIQEEIYALQNQLKWDLAALSQNIDPVS